MRTPEDRRDVPAGSTVFDFHVGARGSDEGQG